jgi:hypothetical protein
MCPIETIATLQLGPGGLDALGLAAMLALFATRVAQQAQLLRPAAAA